MSRPLIEEEIMAEYIEREAILRHLDECKGTPPEICYTYPIFVALECFVKNLPAADVAEVKHGEWKLYGNDDDIGSSFFCSLCGWNIDEDEYLDNWSHFHFCPNCGAKMKG
jgi:hypothetical protein